MHRFLNLVYAWCISHLDPEAREQWDADLEAPLDPTSKAPPSEAQVESEGMAFMDLMKMAEGGLEGAAAG